MIRLLAMSPSGEVYFSQDALGRVWRHDCLGGLDPLEVSIRTVDRVVTEHGYDRVEVDFADWSAIEREVAERTRKVVMPNLAVNRTVARAMLPVLDKWLSSEHDRALVVPLASKLLTDDAVAADSELRVALLDRIEQAAKSNERTPLILVSQSTTGDRARVPQDYFAPSTAAA